MSLNAGTALHYLALQDGQGKKTHSLEVQKRDAAQIGVFLLLPLVGRLT